MKVVLVIKSIARKNGGPSRSVQGMAAALNRAGVETWLLTLDRGEEPWIEGVKNFVNGGDLGLVLAEVKPDIVHLNDLWQPALHRCAAMCRRRGVKYVMAPRGTLAPWALSVKKWKKRIAWWLYQRRDLELAAALQATAASEAEQFRAMGLKNPIIISPNGVELPESRKCECEKARTEKQERVAVFMGRLHPGKGLLTLAEAWAKVRPQGWRMVVVGPDRYNHKKDIVAKLEELGIRDEWQFVDMVGDEEKWKYYRQADLLIHPSVSENFGITIAEGLAVGLPVICTRGTPWQDIEEHKCGWWIDIGVVPLTQALQAAVALSDEDCQAMGERGQKLIKEKYTWDAAVKTMIRGYKEVLK